MLIFVKLYLPWQSWVKGRRIR